MGRTHSNVYTIAPTSRRRLSTDYLAHGRRLSSAADYFVDLFWHRLAVSWRHRRAVAHHVTGNKRWLDMLITVL